MQNFLSSKEIQMVCQSHSMDEANSSEKWNVFCTHKTRAKSNLVHWVRLFSESLLCAHYGPQPSLLSPVVVGSPTIWCSFLAALGCTVLSSGSSWCSQRSSPSLDSESSRQQIRGAASLKGQISLCQSLPSPYWSSNWKGLLLTSEVFAWEALL